ncbi:hypothetical protein [Methylobrevis albus]|uniref:Oxidoreductase molybdopterin-binding domain-containing protein n=1 Tax=Methylobrevis albus TaxID=2793297 RepID=A0A931I5B4_9HYPH|nr:hypothetical protein [Methylobrevis albus]MBH0239849.1 hypothetical protein [Methylobrevis albus]
MKTAIRLAAGLAFALTLVAPQAALALDAPKGPVVLTITGAISETNAPDAAEFDLEMLEALAGRVTETETPWIDGKRRFEGPLGRAVLDAVGASGETLNVVALNDYAAEIPVEDFRTLDVILATRLDGKPMSVREKGPLFVIYPFDADSSLYNEKYFNRSVWQVARIEVH